MTDRRRAARTHSGRAAPGRGRYAALDLGTNNCRLLVAEPANSGGLRVVEAYSQIVRLGEGLAASGRLSDPAMDRALEALTVCRDRVVRTGADTVMCVATEACRAAANGRDFLSRVKRSTGLDVRLLAPKDEAKFALLGSLDLIGDDKDFALVVDIGGGSTELSWVDARTARSRGIAGCALRPPILGWASFPVGVVTLSESLTDDLPGWYARMVDYVADLMASNDAASRFGPLFEAGRGRLVGNSGTVTCLSAVHQGLEKYSRTRVDGSWLSPENVIATRQRLHDATPAERAAHPCIGRERADLILGGCAILEAIWRLWPSDRLRVGDRGLREGMVLSMIHRSKDAGPARRRRHRSGNSGASSTGGEA